MSKTERRKFRERDLERVQRLKSGLPIDDILIDERPENFNKDDATKGAVGGLFESSTPGVRCSSVADMGQAVENCAKLMHADGLLRRPKIAESRCRIAANIFENKQCSQ
ncbi:uncharacterized protein [Procambarus clarkii]